jgi:hypothetical protein
VTTANSIADLKAYCHKHAHSILVPERLNGKLDTYAFADLSADRQKFYLRQWFAEGITPPANLVPRNHEQERG